MIFDKHLQNVDNHWAVLAVGDVKRDQGLALTQSKLVKKAVGHQMEIDLDESDQSADMLRRIAMAYEMAAIEGLGHLLNPASENLDLREQCIAGAWRTFEIRRLFDIPEHPEERILHILHLSALAYCGERWSDLRRWYKENEQSIFVPESDDIPWNKRLIYCLYDCWVKLFRKQQWNDLECVGALILKLREEQKIYESSVLNNGSDDETRAMAFRLVSIYHWAKSTELLAQYMLQGEPLSIYTLLDKHFESAIKAAAAGADSNLEILMRWLHGAARRMVAGSIWWAARVGNSRVTQFVQKITKQQAMFELLPPQLAALQEQGLLDQATTAVVVDMPTSGGKTLLAQFKILQALNQFDGENGWVAYVAPTRALTAQITRRLRRDFDPIGIKVEQLTGAVEVDAFEDQLLSQKGTDSSFDILVSTPEKLQLVIRNNKVPRPLALVVMDEAHNIEDETRGLRIELLLATIKRECMSAKFLLLMPYVERPEVLARWLAQDVNAGRAISFGTTPWKPNERIIGMYEVEGDSSVRGGWQLVYKSLVTTTKAIHLTGKHKVGGVRPLKVAKSGLTRSLETAAMATIFSNRGTSIAVATQINSVWTMAREIGEVLHPLSPIPEEIRLVQDFLKTEISPNFELADLLSKGIGVHHAGLSDEVRALMEWLAEEAKLRVLCATTTIAQGMNFPVASVFLASRFVPNGRFSKEMSPRDFWNLAGRAGRIDHDSVGVVGLAAGERAEEIVNYVARATGELVSRIVKLLDELERAGNLNNLETVIQGEQWEDFRCYVAHLWNEKKNLEAVLADAEQLLRHTFGYSALQNSVNGKEKAERLLEATKNYAIQLSNNPGAATLADMTGFSPEGVGQALAGLNKLERKLTLADFSTESLFGKSNGMAELFGVMLRVPQLANSLEEIAGKGGTNKHISEITAAWVEGQSIQEIAQAYFAGEGNQTQAITNACRAIYRNLVNTGTWGLSALSRLSGINFDELSDEERHQINVLPAMIYHGVKSEEAVLMRMNSVPRSIAVQLGEEFRKRSGKPVSSVGISSVREFLKNLDANEWGRMCPEGSHLTGAGYKRVWEVLSGERR